MKTPGELRALRTFGLVATLVALAPKPARAHLVTTGLGPLFDGTSHLAVTPEDLLPTLAIALLVGLRGREHARAVLVALPISWLIAGGIGLARPFEIPLGITVVSFLAFGGLVAGDVKLSRRAVTFLAIAMGSLHGYLNGLEMAVAGLGIVGLVGATLAVFVVLTLASALVVSLERPWTRIAVRVAGSWVVAIGLLLVGWSLR